MILKIDPELKTRFSNLTAPIVYIEGVKVRKKTEALEKFKLEVINQVIQDYDLESVKDYPLFRAYRDFFWSLGIDPTKNRPAAEALTRRILAGKPLPCINTLVDAYNLASINSGIAIATFDTDRLEGELSMRFAKEKETILGIGMNEPFILKGGEIVVSDQEKLVAIYPYRDADNTKVTTETKNVTIVICGVPGIKQKRLEIASELVQEYIFRFCNGQEG